MVSKINKGIRILFNDGPYEFATQSINYFSTQLKKVYWRAKGAQRLTTYGYTGEFITPDYTVARQNRYRLQSELRILSDLLSESETDDVFFDVGANTGLYSIFAAKRLAAGRVVAFEPYPPNYDLLVRNIARNDADNINPIRLALSDTEGTIQFDQPTTEEAGFGSASIGTDADEDGTEVKTNTCDNLVKEAAVPNPSVVKIDVEGAEALVIDGMRETLSTPSCRLVYCEIHDGPSTRRPSIEEFGSSMEDVIEILQECGFNVEVISERTNETFLKFKK